MPERRIDLHAHSAVSDGTETPAELVAAALATGLDTVALTDHDTTAGWREAFDAAAGTGLTVVPGMELSTSQGEGSVHVLGYLFDPADAALLAETERIRTSRVTRAERIVARIAADYDISWEEVLAQAGEGETIGRPHIADALVARGVIPDRTTAFHTMLHRNGPYYERYYAPTPAEGVGLIRRAGGVAVLAHPATAARVSTLDRDSIRELAEAGLFGLEVEHRDNTEQGKTLLREYAREFGLVITGSSDYHGTGKPNRLGEHTTAPEVLETILAAGTGSAPFRG